MGYVQIDGNKSFLINEDGQVRQGLRNLPLDSDRYIYERNADGSIKNVWPKFIISQGIETGEEDIRLLPEIVLKEHGSLPRTLECSADDFIAKDGDYLNVAKANIEYVGDGSFKATKPYKDKGGTSEPKAAPATGPPAPQQPSEPKEESSTGVVADVPPVSEPKPESELSKTSGEMTAKEAIKIIGKFDFGELQDSGFYTEEEREGGPRVTVQDAWERAKKQYLSDLKS